MAHKPCSDPQLSGSSVHSARVPLSWPIRFAYGCGGVVERIGNQSIKDLGNPIYNLILGINPVLIGVVIMVTRLFDAFFDPVVGNWSDNTRTRWGRRRPFLLAGSLLAGIAFVPVFWMPEWLGAHAQFIWMLLFGIVFYACFTLFSIPYRALAYEIAPGYHEKTQLLSLRLVFMMSVSAIQPWVFPLTQSGWLGDPRASIPWIFGSLGLILTITGLVPTFAIKEPPSPTCQPGGRVSLRESLGDTLRCRPFLLLLAANTANMIGVNLSFGLGNYIVIYYVYGGHPKAAASLLGWSGMVFSGFAIFAAPVMTALSRRFGKREVQLGALALAALGALFSWWLYSPVHPWLMLLLPLFLAPGMIGLWMFGESMVGDVCQVETLRTGFHREAIFSAVFGWILKAAAAVAVLGSNLMLNATGFDVALGAAQPPGVGFGMRIIFVSFLLIGFLTSLLLLWHHRLDEATMLRVRAELDARAASDFTQSQAPSRPHPPPEA